MDVGENILDMGRLYDTVIQCDQQYLFFFVREEPVLFGVSDGGCEDTALEKSIIQELVELLRLLSKS